MADLVGTIDESGKATSREWLGLAVIALPCMLYSMDLTVLNIAVRRWARRLVRRGTSRPSVHGCELQVPATYRRSPACNCLRSACGDCTLLQRRFVELREERALGSREPAL